MKKLELTVLLSKTVKELKKIASELKIPGRSYLTTKDSLAVAINSYMEDILLEDEQQESFFNQEDPRPIVVAKTIREVNNFILDRDSHARLASFAMRKTVYKKSFVIDMITITNVTEEGELIYSVESMAGGNSPVMRKVYEREGGEKKASCKAIATLDKDGNISSYRDVVCDMDVEDGISYYSVNSIKNLKLRLSTRFKKKEKEADLKRNERLTQDILSKGLSITTNEEGKTIVKLGGDFLPFIWTPSNERNGQMLLTNMEAKDKWSLLEEIGGGTITDVLKANNGQMPIKKFIKMASRLGLFATPAIEFGKVGTKKDGVLILKKELLGADNFNEEQKKELEKISVSVDRNQWDGAAYFSCNFARRAMKRAFNIRIANYQANKFAYQLRANIFYAKVFGEALHQSIINKLVAYIKKYFKEGEDYIIVGNKEKVSMVVDGNAAKIIDFDKCREGNMQVYLLDIAKGTFSRTSTQALDKFSVIDPKLTAKLLKLKAKEDAHSFVENIGLTMSDIFNDDINVAQTLISLARQNPESTLAANVFSDFSILAEIAKDLAIKQEGAFKKCSISIDSLFLRAIFDISYLLTDRKIPTLLGINAVGAIECYNTDVLELNREKIEEIESNDSLNSEQKDIELRKILSGAMIKYPTPGREEIQRIVFLTDNQIIRKLDNLVNNEILSNDEAYDVFRYFKDTSYGTIKISADNVVKLMLAGMDTDYDGVCVIMDTDLLSILDKSYEEKTQKIQKATGLCGFFGGVLPFIDSRKKEEILKFKTEEKEEEEELEENLFEGLTSEDLF